MRALVLGGVSWNRLIHLDRLPDPVPATIHARRVHEALGGTGAGKAWNLAALGCEVDLVTAVGDDPSGRLVLDAVTRIGVRVHAVHDPAGTEQHTNLMAGDGGRISIYTNTSSSDLPLDLDRIVRLASVADLVCVNINGFCRPALARLRDEGVPIWTDLHDYDGRDPYHRDFVDAATWLQVSSDRLPEWRRWGEGRLAAGAGIVVVTHGAAGADADDGSGWRHVPVERVPVVDTNGAGDAFFAGFATAHAMGAGPTDALAAGAAAAARSVQSDGLGPPIAR